MEFCIAALLLYGKAGLNEFTDKIVNRPDVQAMIQRLHFGVNAEAEQAGYNKMTTIIELHLKDGRIISGRADFGKGSPADPLTLRRCFSQVPGHLELRPLAQQQGQRHHKSGSETRGRARCPHVDSPLRNLRSRA